MLKVYLRRGNEIFKEKQQAERSSFVKNAAAIQQEHVEGVFINGDISIK